MQDRVKNDKHLIEYKERVVLDKLDSNESNGDDQSNKTHSVYPRNVRKPKDHSTNTHPEIEKKIKHSEKSTRYTEFLRTRRSTGFNFISKNYKINISKSKLV